MVVQNVVWVNFTSTIAKEILVTYAAIKASLLLQTQ